MSDPRRTPLFDLHRELGGRIVESGGPELVVKLENEGYDWLREKYPEAARDEDVIEAKPQTAGARF